MAIKIKRSTTQATPSTLVAGQLGYSEVSDNLFFGKSDGSVLKIGGKSDVDKLAGIEAGAEVNTVDSVAGQTGAVTASQILAEGTLGGLSDVNAPTPSNDQVLTWDAASSKWIAAASGSGGVTTFIALNDTPVAFTGSGGYFLRVNAGATALEFTQDIDDGTF